MCGPELELVLNACHLISSHYFSTWTRSPFTYPDHVAVDGSFREVAGKCAARGSGVVQIYQHGGNEP